MQVRVRVQVKRLSKTLVIPPKENHSDAVVHIILQKTTPHSVITLLYAAWHIMAVFCSVICMYYGLISNIIIYVHYVL